MRMLKMAVLGAVAWLVIVSPVMAYKTTKDAKGNIVEGGGPDHATFAGAAVGAGLGAGITILGAGVGFGRIGSSALESMARQPEVAGRIQTAMIVIAALLEGATFFALIVCITVGGKATF